jgi:hypothetical protein
MKTRTVKNDPISAIERDRGVIVRVQVMLDSDEQLRADKPQQAAK